MRAKIDKKKNVKHFYFNGDLKDEIALCANELEKKEKELQMYELIYKKAYRACQRKFDRVDDLKDEIALCVNKLEKKEKELQMYELIYEKAYREYKRKFDRVNDLNDFIEMALEKIEEDCENDGI